MEHQKPTVGRVVHYHHTKDGTTVTTLAAIVVKVFSDTCVNLQVLNDGYTDDLGGNVALRTSVTQAGEYGAPYGWSWPPRA